MEWTAQYSKTIAAILAFLLTTSAITGLYYWDKSGDLAREKDKTTLRADSLLSVKLNLERDIISLSMDLSNARTDNETITQKLTSAQSLLSKKNKVLAKLSKESDVQKGDLAALRDQVSELTELKGDLKAEVEKYQLEKDTWLSENSRLKKNNETLQTQITDLTTQLGGMAPKSVITANNFRVDVLKNNHKVTAKAKKANSILVSFTLPAALTSEGNQSLFLSLTDTENRPMSGVIQHLSFNANETPLDIPVHAVQTADFSQNPQKAVFEFIPNEKVAEGIYKASIYTNSAYLGSVEFHLRDSFLFF
ncbi:hypothetical protein [Runella sp.]|uniref:hypothetical protein n=1 Tax=Runella sp. TaxID=1960881 RepID=UPI003D0DD498